MKNKKLKQIDIEIRKIKNQVIELGEMRPGSLTRQSRIQKNRYGSYWQLSYTYKKRGHTEYIRKSFVPEIRTQIKNYQRFKKLAGRWIELEINQSKLKMKLRKEREP